MTNDRRNVLCCASLAKMIYSAIYHSAVLAEAGEVSAGEVLREYKADLGELVSWEAGKITQEGLGEVQEMMS